MVHLLSLCSVHAFIESSSWITTVFPTPDYYTVILHSIDQLHWLVSLRYAVHMTQNSPNSRNFCFVLDNSLHQQPQHFFIAAEVLITTSWLLFMLACCDACGDKVHSLITIQSLLMEHDIFVSLKITRGLSIVLEPMKIDVPFINLHPDEWNPL